MAFQHSTVVSLLLPRRNISFFVSFFFFSSLEKNDIWMFLHWLGCCSVGIISAGNSVTYCIFCATMSTEKLFKCGCSLLGFEKLNKAWNKIPNYVCEVISWVVATLQKQHPTPFMAGHWRFQTHFSFSSTLPLNNYFLLNLILFSIYSNKLSIFYKQLYTVKCPRWLEPIPAAIGRKAWYALDGLQVHHRATRRQMRNNHAYLCSLLGSI